MDFHYLQRVKVYRLNDEGKWDDKGTGHVSVEYLERSEAVGLVVIDEEDNQTLLVHRISADDIYRRQEDTIISWTDPEVATDLALSFQETMGCSFIWDQICNVQRLIHFPSVGGLESSARPVSDELEHSGTSQDDGNAVYHCAVF
jgi:protein phosphatase-4 regulatory subunit 3